MRPNSINKLLHEKNNREDNPLEEETFKSNF